MGQGSADAQASLTLCTISVPTFLLTVLHQQSYAGSGAIVFLVLAVSAVTQLALARYPSRSVVLGGSACSQWDWQRSSVRWPGPLWRSFSWEPSSAASPS